MSDNFSLQLPDIDPDETKEWLESLDAVAGSAGRQRARFIMSKLLTRAQETQIGTPPTVWTCLLYTSPSPRDS